MVDQFIQFRTRANANGAGGRSIVYWGFHHFARAELRRDNKSRCRLERERKRCEYRRCGRNDVFPQTQQKQHSSGTKGFFGGRYFRVALGTEDALFRFIDPIGTGTGLGTAGMAVQWKLWWPSTIQGVRHGRSPPRWHALHGWLLQQQSVQIGAKFSGEKKPPE